MFLLHEQALKERLILEGQFLETKVVKSHLELTLRTMLLCSAAAFRNCMLEHAGKAERRKPIPNYKSLLHIVLSLSIKAALF